MDLGFIRSLYDNPPGEGGYGYVSVYLDTSPSAESVARLAIRWRSAREQLAEAGADAATLDAAAEVVTERAREAHGLAVFARGGAVRLASTLPRPPARDISSFAPLPRVMPLLTQIPPHVPHVRVGADRTGGVVVAVSDTGPAMRDDVRGESWPIHKVSAGGWSQARYQRSAEETWADNAKRIAEAAAIAADQVHAEFVVIGGDVRERSMVLDSLPKRLRESAVIVDREVAPDSAAFTATAQGEIARRRDAATRARVEELRVRMSAKDRQSRRAAEGLGDTLTALRDALASELLLADDPAPDTAVWIGPDMADAAAAEEQLTERGITPLGQDRAEEVLARAAAGTDASLFFIPADAGRPRDGVAVLLRAPLAAVG
ncbi:MAG TPA: Vms1/Ankzf1 family peptidyl-tRNA hydrolase [Pseudonocardiaceae bacterium]